MGKETHGWRLPQFQAGGGNYPAAVLPGGGRAPAPGSLGDPALLSDPPALWGDSHHLPKQKMPVRKFLPSGPDPAPSSGGLPAKAEAPGPRGGGARCGAGGSGCHGAPPEPRSASPTPTPGPVRGGRVASSNPALFNILQNHWFSAHFLPKTPDTKQETHCPRECRAWKSLLRPLT